jgi:hypothetical protein
MKFIESFNQDHKAEQIDLTHSNPLVHGFNCLGNVSQEESLLLLSVAKMYL